MTIVKGGTMMHGDWYASQKVPRRNEAVYVYCIHRAFRWRKYSRCLL